MLLLTSSSALTTCDLQTSSHFMCSKGHLKNNGSPISVLRKNAFYLQWIWCLYSPGKHVQIHTEGCSKRPVNLFNYTMSFTRRRLGKHRVFAWHTGSVTDRVPITPWNVLVFCGQTGTSSPRTVCLGGHSSFFLAWTVLKPMFIGRRFCIVFGTYVFMQSDCKSSDS